MTLRGKRYCFSVLLFLGVFGALLAVATFYDLEVSRILTRFSLKEGEYYTNNFFANFFEAAGMLPRYALRAFSALSIGWFFYKTLPQKALRVILLLLAFGAAVFLLSGAFRDMIFYPMKHTLAEDINAAEKALRAMKPTVYTLSYFLSASAVGLALFLTRKIPVDIWRRLAYFALVYCVIDFISETAVEGLKGYVDRVRFRSMNSEYGQAVGGFTQYTRWYEVTDHAAAFRATSLTHYTDAFRSFPSGHTESAALSYSLILLIDCLSVEKRGVKIALWTAPIVWTGLTAVGRIVAGAHFMSDVLIGGTIPFVLVVLLREAFFRGFDGVKEMFSLKKPAQKEYN